MYTRNKKTLDEYRVSDILGRGGFSVVRRGIMKTSGDRRQVAIKTLKRLGPSAPSGIPRSRGDGERSFASFKFPTWRQVSVSHALLSNDIFVMRKIVENVSPHQNVVDLYDVYEDQNELFDRIVARDKYSERDAAAVVRQIAEGLGALHRANIVPRDLKPENCLFLNENDDSTLKIMDFGLSSVEEFTDPVVGLFGSIDYVSPEALSQGRISSKTDMWSVGVILYILLSGYPPFIAQSNRQKQVILAGDFSFYEKTWKNITSSAKQLITDLLQVDPERRPSAQDVLNHPWVIGGSAKEEQMDPEIVSRLQSFNARRKFRAAAIASVWSSTIFLRTKKCAKGDNATLSEFEEVLKAMNMSSLIPMAPRIFDLFDNNRDGTVDMREILCGFSSLRNSRGDDALRLCFQALPENCLPADITEPGKLDEIFDRMDASSDGKVTFDEFKAAMQRDSSLQEVLLSSLRQQ
ncbi:hypothetical protein POPTR_008G011541v4 [Populus trichocarpa]|uniref:Uncharacterized protein n=1 Tax=Populus trichocarpa TaxID=3694 RepID=A0ACC0SIV4_POPTR|nr:hypothetical protein BDE02_08G008600 [Populus trichocarpa]KAI9389181.1 hypothetical protein POPTR_008G011541v4 [Populus trichocarpa]